MVRQWGGVYTEKGGNIRQGYLRFNTQQVIDGLNFLKGLSDARIVGIPQAYNESQFGSAPFKRGEIVLTISSSAGVKENLPNNSVDYPFDVSVHPIPYKDVDKKFVISQGTNLALFRRGTKAEQEAAWELLRYLTVDRNAEFSKNTGYFPVSESAQGSELYTSFLNGDSTNYTPGDRAVQDTAILNNDFYLSSDEAWIKFVDPGFVGSSQIRDEVAFIIGKVFYGDQGRPITAQQAIEAAYSRLSSFVEK
jgi:ABC-type glycerol-3-phosphate transport system substrate-binding protein